MISLIAAVANNGVIGSQNEMPWYIPEDLKFFRRMTLGKPVIMGRKTFDSIGKPLPGRRNIVVSRNRDLQIQGADVVTSLERALRLAEKEKPEEVMVIGGGELYRLALPKARRLYLTCIAQAFEGEVRFPEIVQEAWQEQSREDRVSETGLKFSWLVLERKEA